MAAADLIDRLGQALSISMENRSEEVSDLVSNANILLYMMKEKDQFEEYTGPSIRETLMTSLIGGGKWYDGFETWDLRPASIVQDAEWVPASLVVPTTISGTDIMDNAGKAQLKSIIKIHRDAADSEMMNMFNLALHSNGLGFGGKQLTGLQAAIPTVATSGVYAGIDRATQPLWRTAIYDAQTSFAGVTQVTAATIRAIFERIVIERSVGKNGPNLILADQNHYLAFSSALAAIQRITTEGKMAKLGFATLMFQGGGRQIEVALEGGQGTNMPADTSYFIDTKSLKVRYHKDRYFKPFGWQRSPVNQDAVIVNMGFRGQLTMTNPRHMAKLIDSNPAT